MSQDFSDGSPQRRDGLSVVPWEERQPQLVFRGSNKADSIPFSNNRGLKSIRGRAAVLASSHPKLLDIRLFDPACKQSQPPNCRDADVGVQYYGRLVLTMAGGQAGRQAGSHRPPTCCTVIRAATDLPCC